MSAVANRSFANGVYARETTMAAKPPAAEDSGTRLLADDDDAPPSADRYGRFSVATIRARVALLADSCA